MKDKTSTTLDLAIIDLCRGLSRRCSLRPRGGEEARVGHRDYLGVVRTFSRVGDSLHRAESGEAELG
jgi:hypothetical protein